VVLIGGALTLYAWRAPLLKSQAGFELLARESFLLFNNILLVIATATVLAGTLAPLIAGALGLGTLSVGAPYFNPTFLVSMLPLLSLVSVGIHASWKKGRLSDQKRILLITFVVAAVLGCGLALGVYSGGHVLTPVGATLGIWIVLSSLVDPIDRLRRKLTLPRAVLGMAVAHIGLGFTVIALTTVTSFTAEHDVSLAQGASATLGDYEFRFEGVKPVEGPNYDGVSGTIAVSRHGRPLTTVYPEKRRYWVQQQVTTESAIKMEGGSNLLVALGEDLGAGRWSIRLQVRPLVNLIWIGAFIMALGGGLAASDRRYRLAKVPAESPVPITAVTRSEVG
jgi:cytochrome c-type biogenesis protein CcmF